MGTAYDWERDDGFILTAPRSAPTGTARRSAPRQAPLPPQRSCPPRKRPPRRRRRFHRLPTMGAALIAAAVILAVWAAAGRPSSAQLRDKTAPPPSPAPSTAPTQLTANNTGDISAPDWVTENLLPLNEYSRPGDPLPQVNGVVVHYVGNPGTTAEQNRSYFAGLAQSGATYASSHFIVGMDGTVVQCVPLNEIAYCSTTRNADTISIECCHPDEDGEFTQETMDSLIRLLDWLIDTYGLQREDVIRHYDVAGKECPIYYVRHPDAWEALLDGLTFPET